MKLAIFTLMLVCFNIIGFSQTGKHANSVNLNEEKEKQAIIETVNAETENFFKGDYEGVIKCFVHSDYAFHAWNNSDGTFNATVGWPAINENYKNYIGSNPVKEGTSSHPMVERRNIIFKFFNSEVAFVT